MAKKSVLITGCSAGGIGSALAETFHERGYHVFATGRNLDKLSHFKDKPDITLLKLDVSDESQVAAAAEAVKAHPASSGKLDVLVNNAGINYFTPVLDTDISEAKRIYDANVWGPLRMMKAFAPLLIASKGQLVNICSIAGHLNTPWMGVYGGSKYALEMLSETVRLELAPFGVAVLGVVTGAVSTLGQSYFDDFKLPESSIYAPAEKQIALRAQGKDGFPRMDAKKYASGVVDDVQARKSGLVWRGSNASNCRLLAHLPQSVMDMAISPKNGLETLSASQKK